MSDDKEQLLWGVKNGDMAVVEKIVSTVCGRSEWVLLFTDSQGGINVNEELSGGRSPIHFAADYGQKQVIEYLISKGASVDVSTTQSIIYSLIILLL